MTSYGILDVLHLETRAPLQFVTLTQAGSVPADLQRCLGRVPSCSSAMCRTYMPTAWPPKPARTSRPVTSTQVHAPLVAIHLQSVWCFFMLLLWMPSRQQKPMGEGRISAYLNVTERIVNNR